ncbi:hypothetical protein DL93DRAFT_2166122 [Clavulina sp. PMI_390]|nr:hypothetical protein DL93DRAFT_2166122 [Clavulina sp. PMI_390]
MPILKAYFRIWLVMMSFAVEIRSHLRKAEYDAGSFPQLFLPELRAEIISHLAPKDLQNYSLSSKLLRADAARIMWTNVVLDPCYSCERSSAELLSDFASFLLESPTRAISVKSLSVRDGDYTKSDKFCIFPSPEHATASFWTHFHSGLGLLTAVKRLKLDFRPDHPTQELCNAILSAPFKNTVSTLHYSGSLPHFFIFINAYHNITTVRTGQLGKEEQQSHELFDANIQLDAASHVVKMTVHGDPSILKSISQRASLHTVALRSSFWKNRNPPTIGDTLRMSETLKVASIHCEVEYDPLEFPNSLLEKVAHPSVTSLEIVGTVEDAPHEWGEGGFPGVLFMLLEKRDQAITRFFPSLKFLHLVLDHGEFVTTFFPILADLIPDFDEVPERHTWRLDHKLIKSTKKAIGAFLKEEAADAPLELAWFDYGGHGEFDTFAIRFEADKIDGKWQVRAIKCEPEVSVIQMPC